jgi:hypothetical protein
MPLFSQKGKGAIRRLNSSADAQLGILPRIWLKIRHRIVIEEALERLSRVGIQIQLYLLVLEGLSDRQLPQWESGFSEYEVGFLSPDEVQMAAVISGRVIAKETFLQRLRENKKCFGVKYGHKVVAYTWCDLAECHHPGNQFPLKHNEAYLFDAFTSREFRGRDIAPYMRYQCYKELAKIGRHRLYSVTSRFNTSARRFKQKLGAHSLELCLFVHLLKKWHFHIRLKKYS